MFSSRGVGAYVASEVSINLARRTAKPQADYPLLFFPGHGSTGDAFLPAGTLVTTDSDWHKATETGYDCLCCDWGGGATWGNDTAVSAAGSGLTFLQGTSSPVRAKAGKTFIFASSMGTLTALNYARANPSNVAAIGAIQGVVDVADVHDNDRGSFATDIETAYGGAASYATAMPGHNPAANTAGVAGIPIRLWYGTSDTVVLPATQTAYAAANPSTVTATSIGAVGHNNVGSFTFEQLLAFFAPYRY